MVNSNNLALVEEFFLMMQTPSSPQSQPTLISTTIDLTEFHFTEAELEKFRRLCRKLELSLLTEFVKHFEAAAVVVEIRSSPRA